jgi:hypothetical protein
VVSQINLIASGLMGALKCPHVLDWMSLTAGIKSIKNQLSNVFMNEKGFENNQWTGDKN